MRDRYPFYIYSNVRQTFDLEPTDTSMDKEINELSRRDVLEKYLNWEGLIGYADEIIDVIQDIYEVDLDEY
jgi:hypothetical protein